jgi:small subunit ribosomal protein S21
MFQWRGLWPWMQVVGRLKIAASNPGQNIRSEAHVLIQEIGVDGARGGWLLLILSPANTSPFIMSIEIKLRKNEPIDRALRRMKKKLDRENIIKDVRAKRYAEKPCERRRRKEKVMAFTAMLRARHAN